MANWLQFQENLRETSQGLGEYIREKQAKQDAFQAFIFKSAIEQKMKEQAMQVNLQRNLEMLKQLGFGLPQRQQTNIVDTTTQIEPVVKDEYMTQVEPSLNAEGGLSFGFKKVLSPEAQIRQKVTETKAIELAKGIPADKAGLYNLAKESVKNIRDVKKTLFPTGKAESYKRWTAYGSNPILSQLPGVPQFFPFRQNPQDVYRKISAALSGRQLIQTGVAARPEETAKLVSQFAPSGMSQSQAALNGLNELEDFYTNYINTLETKGLREGRTNNNLSGIFDDLLPK